MIIESSKLLQMKITIQDVCLFLIPCVLVYQLCTQPTQFCGGFLCRGVWLKCKKNYADPPFTHKNTPTMPEISKKKRARKPHSGNTGTHDYI